MVLTFYGTEYFVSNRGVPVRYATEIEGDVLRMYDPAQDDGFVETTSDFI
jgi:hypothetical protein